MNVAPSPSRGGEGWGGDGGHQRRNCSPSRVFNPIPLLPVQSQTSLRDLPLEGEGVRASTALRKEEKSDVYILVALAGEGVFDLKMELRNPQKH